MTDPTRARAKAITHELYSRFHGPVRVRARKLLQADEGAAHEAVQDTFMAAFRRCMDDLKGNGGPQLVGVGEDLQRAWLLTVVARKSIDRIRKDARELPSPDLNADPLPLPWAQQDPQVIVENQERTETFWQTISEYLTPVEHIVAVLSFEFGVPDFEIARILNITEGTVRSNRSRAKKKIKDIDPVIMFPDNPRVTDDETEAKA